MSGHSKWATIKHKKSAQDSRRGKLFSRIIKEITVAARGGADPEGNPRLRMAIVSARAANMPNENIERAIKRGAGNLDGSSYSELSYEGYGPGGVAILVDVLTDNKNRTAAEMRHLFTRHGGSLGGPGCVAYLFHTRGVVAYSAEQYEEDAIIEQALEGGALDISSVDGVIEVICEPDRLAGLVGDMGRHGFEQMSAEIVKIPDATVSLDEDGWRKALGLIEGLDDHEDIQRVSTNLDCPDINPD